jgi:CubicO group peptidase (beta-lactamase class C family)
MGENEMRQKSEWPLSTAEPEQQGLCSERMKRVDGLMDRFIAERKIAGSITAVVRNDRLAHLACHGMMDAENECPMREDAIFRIYSMSKPITSVAVLMLYEEGCFFLDDPLQEYLPAFGDVKVRVNDEKGGEKLVDPKRPITIHDVMTHTAGFSYDLTQGAKEKGWDLETFADAFAKVPLIGQPGEKWAYSASQDVLGRLVEVVSGKRFDAFLQERIFAPLGMVDSGFFVPEEKWDRLAVLYEMDGQERIVPRSHEDHLYTKEPSFFSGGGGLVSTASDYLRFCLMLLHDGTFEGKHLLGRKTVELMRQDHLPPGHPPIQPFKFGYGLGVSVLRSLSEKQGIGSVGEYGWGGAASTHAWIDPAENMVSIVMMQLMPPRRLGMTEKVKDAIYQALI